MADIKEFNGYIANKEKVKSIACFPYDVLSPQDALRLSKNKDSFSNIIRSESKLDVDKYDIKVYKEARKNLMEFIKNGNIIKRTNKEFYIFRQTFNKKVQVGLVATINIDEYKNNVVKKHELTRIEKETDRINHFQYTKFNTEPVFLVYKKHNEVKKILNEEIKKNDKLINFTKDGIKNELFVIRDKNVIEDLKNIFKRIDSLYIADGHHRAKASYEVGKIFRKKTKNYKKDDELNYFMGVLFSTDDIKIIDYNRAVINIKKNLDTVLSELEKHFLIKKTNEKNLRPKNKNEFGFYFKKNYFKLTIKKELLKNLSLPESLDVSLLQTFALKPIFNIKNPRKDRNIDFIGGSRGLKFLIKYAQKNNGAAFVLHPVSIEDITKVSDKGKIMPPKSTWFIPKLMSGVFLHKLI